jgi:hypothetical protein
MELQNISQKKKILSIFYRNGLEQRFVGFSSKKIYFLLLCLVEVKTNLQFCLKRCDDEMRKKQQSQKQAKESVIDLVQKDREDAAGFHVYFILFYFYLFTLHKR